MYINQIMKKIKTINKLLSSLTLLSPLAGIGFNNQYQNTQKVITENSNNSLNNYVANQINEQRTMGDITVTVEGTTITRFVSSSGEGELIVDSDITEIGMYAFSDNEDITSLDLSQATSLTTIGQGAFYSWEKINCNELPIIIPSSVTNIGDKAFYNGICSLKRDICFLSETPPKFGNLWIYNNTSHSFGEFLGNIYVPSEQAKQDYLNAPNFGFNQSSKNVLINGTTFGNELMGNIFVKVKDYQNTREIIEYISGEGFLQIPSNVTSVASDVFKGIKITSLDLSCATSLTTIGNEAFSGCTNLSGDLVVPSSVTNIGQQAFGNCYNINSLDLSQATNLTTIGNYAFYDCKNLSGDLVIPSSVQNIGDYAFRYANITSLDLSQATSLTTIGSNSFSGSKLTGDLVIPSSVQNIGDYAFRNTKIDNLYFLSETPPSFDVSWNPTITGKVYVPSEQAKQAYLDSPDFNFTKDQVEIIYP